LPGAWKLASKIMIEEQLDLLCRKLDQVLARAPDLAAPPPAGAAGLTDEALKSFLQLLRQKLDDLQQDHRELSVALGCLGETVDTRLGALAEQLRARAMPGATGVSPGATGSASAPLGATGSASAMPGGTGGAPVLVGSKQPEAPRIAETPPADWQRAILGRALAEQPGLESERQRLFAALLGGESAACGLAGQLLVFQSASAERMPPLLKDIGEAYYRWQPKSRPQPSVLEQALVRALLRTCEAAGIANTIELVGPGERFDSTRHNASMRGVEITEVHGWVVLRDNGKVYTKATVSVR
jgi:hypothetical protein